MVYIVRTLEEESEGGRGDCGGAVSEPIQSISLCSFTSIGDRRSFKTCLNNSEFSQNAHFVVQRMDVR